MPWRSFLLEEPAMRFHLFILSISLLALLLALQPSDANDGKKKIKPTQIWSGKISDDALSKLAPKSGCLLDQRAFEALWAGWDLKGKAPKIDFTKHLVFVQLATGGPNVPQSSYTLDAKGDLTVLSLSTLIGGPGFGYSIDVLPKDGIKTYMGKKIAEGK
jgi:hypothetical protein